MTINNKTHKKELIELREKINHSSDEEIGNAMQAEWEHGIIPDAQVKDTDLQRIKQDIHVKIGKQPNRGNTFLRWMQLAAAITLPICLVVMGFMYHKNQQYASIPMTKIATLAEEQVSITLPDGSIISLNSLSELRYAPQSFCQTNREVYFEGEAHYRVAKDPQHPFVIHSQGMELKVLGTEFNITNRAKEDIAEVALLNGSIMLTSLVNHQTHTMKPNEIVKINKYTGHMDIEQSLYVKDACAWQQKQMVFHDANLQKVIGSLEKQYGIHIQMRTKASSPFTGTLPTNNLKEAMQIISVSYDMKVVKTCSDMYIFK